MWTSAAVLLICLKCAFANQLVLFSNNGWVPVSSNIVYNQIRHGITHPPRFTKADDVQVLKTNILSFVSKHPDYEETTLEEDNQENIEKPTNLDDGSEDKPRLLLKNNVEPKKLQPSNNQNLMIEASVRRSKKLADISSNFLLNNILSKNTHEYKNFLKKNDIVKVEDKLFSEDDAHTYEVTEKYTAEERKQEESVVKEKGYEYNPPIKQNFTNDLIKHLSKYNTQDVNNLQNYALSRRPKSASPVIQDHLHKTLHSIVPIRSNSLNHLLVDPLLAVFLSNYGHYLRGQYGIQNNYNNLYGYLASNNIHNNRPFGLYKLFSDTDSSNK